MHLFTLRPPPLTFQPQNHITNGTSQGHSVYQVWTLSAHTFMSYVPDKQTAVNVLPTTTDSEPMEITDINHNEAKAVQHVHPANFPVWIKSAGRSPRRTCLRSKRSTSGAFECCPKWWCSEANKATETHCDNNNNNNNKLYWIWKARRLDYNRHQNINNKQ